MPPLQTLAAEREGSFSCASTAVLRMKGLKRLSAGGGIGNAGLNWQIPISPKLDSALAI
jgi:hypothetical protein